MARAVKFIRSLRDWSQRRLARAAGMDQGQVSRYESGQMIPTPAILKRMAAAARVPFALVELALPYLRECAEEGAASPPEPAPGGAAGVAAAVARAVSGVVEAAALEELSKLDLFAEHATEREDDVPVDELWRNLADLSESEQVGLVDGGREYRSATLCVRVCSESERAAAAVAGRALGLARVALRIAARVEGTAAWRARISGYAWAHFANARRVANDLAGAERAFCKAWKLWEAGAEAADDGLLDPARLLDLEASLRRAQRRFGEALRLHDRAFEAVSSDSAAYILLNKAVTFEQAGRYGRAIETLAEAAPLIDEQREPRQLCVLRFNMAVNLCHLDRHAEAEALVPEIRRMAEALGHDLDLVRVRWLEAKVLAGLGRREEAAAALEEVRRGLAARALPYDMALASLDLAALYLEDGRAAEVQEIAEEMLAIFVAQKVGREALMALQVFHRAARADKATAGLARRLAGYFEQARRDPRLKFRS